ncbi:MAG: hypothetical protein HQ567_08705 [Candidatus Nealsonbacteria bacterium]|nr:hypothetical protein [Candidatus Nealsonbacteria bacterium]
MQLIGKWQLAAHGENAHIIAMPHVTREQIDALIDDLADEVPDSAEEGFLARGGGI